MRPSDQNQELNSIWSRSVTSAFFVPNPAQKLRAQWPYGIGFGKRQQAKERH